MYTMEYHPAIKNQGIPTICGNMDGPWGHYAKWNRQRKRNNVWSHLHEESDKQNKTKTLLEKDIRLVFSRGRGWGEG